MSTPLCPGEHQPYKGADFLLGGGWWPCRFTLLRCIFLFDVVACWLCRYTFLAEHFLVRCCGSLLAVSFCLSVYIDQQFRASSTSCSSQRVYSTSNQALRGSWFWVWSFVFLFMWCYFGVNYVDKFTDHVLPPSSTSWPPSSTRLADLACLFAFAAVVQFSVHLCVVAFC